MPFAEPPPPFFGSDRASFDGTLMLILGVMFLVATFRGDTTAMAPFWLWIITATGFAISALLIIEGSILFLTGVGPF